MILYPRKGKCDQWQNCYQLQHPYLIWRIHLSDPQFKPLISDLLRFPQIYLFIIYSLVWYLPMKTDMFSMDFNLDYINPEEEEGLDKNEEGEGANQPYSGEKSNKCNQCDYASYHAGDLRRHLKRHSMWTQGWTWRY